MQFELISNSRWKPLEQSFFASSEQRREVHALILIVTYWNGHETSDTLHLEPGLASKLAYWRQHKLQEVMKRPVIRILGGQIDVELCGPFEGSTKPQENGSEFLNECTAQNERLAPHS